MSRIVLSLALLVICPEVLRPQIHWVEQNSGTAKTLTSVSASWDFFFGFSYVWTCGKEGTVLRSINAGYNWQDANLGEIPDSVDLDHILCVNANIALVAGNPGTESYLYRTSNGGQNWSVVFSGTGHINAVCLPEGRMLMIGNPADGRWSIWKSTDLGVTWDSAGMYLPQSGNELGWNNSVWCNYARVWFGTDNSRIYYSGNSGSTWTVQPTPGNADTKAVWFFRQTGSVDGLSGGSELMLSSNYGSNWLIQSAPGTGSIRGITGGPDFVGDGGNFMYTFYIRTSDRIYMSEFSNTWLQHYRAQSGNYTHIGSGFGATKFWAVRDNGGISYLDLPVGIRNTGAEIPKESSLGQNYPNPFNPFTNIEFRVRYPGNVRISLYDVLGREVLTIVDKFLNEGSYSAGLQAGNLNSGVYFYRMTANGFTDTKLMLLKK